jgi:hypothetical protein
MYFPTMRIRKITRDYLLSIAFWLTTSVLVAWQDYTPRNRAEADHKPQ